MKKNDFKYNKNHAMSGDVNINDAISSELLISTNISAFTVIFLTSEKITPSRAHTIHYDCKMVLY